MSDLLKLSKAQCDVDEFKDIIETVKHDSLTKEAEILPSLVTERKEISKLVNKALDKEKCYHDSKLCITNKIGKTQCELTALHMQIEKVFEEPTKRYENSIKETIQKIDEEMASTTEAVNNHMKEISSLSNMFNELPKVYDKNKLKTEVEILIKQCEENKAKVVEMSAKVEYQKELLEEFNKTKGVSSLDNLATVLYELGDWGAEDKYLEDEVKYWDECVKTLMKK